jgi:hypothetical protein
VATWSGNDSASERATLGTAREYAPVLSGNECDALILEAKTVIAEGLVSNTVNNNASVDPEYSQLGERAFLPMG